MSSINGLLNVIDSSLILLDVPFIRWFIIIMIILYNITAVPQINNTIAQWFRWMWFRLFFMLVILYVGYKDKILALLLGISFVLSIQNLSMSTRDNSHTVKPYVEEINEPDVSENDGASNVEDVNASHIEQKEHIEDYLNSQFDDPLRSFKNTSPCNANIDVAVTDKDKEILGNPCSLNKD
tara:strand:- start:5269 stop:5811 length:543 start_codon:yes stop_codon:yes gene_type:complete